MAAQPLTRSRLTQIVVMLTLLIGAFWWRSVSFSEREVLCSVGSTCTFSFKQHQLVLREKENRLSLESEHPIDFGVTAIGDQQRLQVKYPERISYPLTVEGLILETGHERLIVRMVPKRE